MSDTGIHWVAQLTIAEGKLADFKARAQETIASVRANEPGALAYEWHISEDGRICNVDEWYADTEAALAHVRGEAVTENLPRLLEVSAFTALWVYTGIADPELRGALTAFGAVFTDRWSGLSP
jgi:quinol monooxygenase YgiN